MAVVPLAEAAAIAIVISQSHGFNKVSPVAAPPPAPPGPAFETAALLDEEASFVTRYHLERGSVTYTQKQDGLTER